MVMMPTYNGKGMAMLDVGANAENTAEQLYDFAIMGNIYAKNIRGIQEPKVALLNIGTESKKVMKRISRHISSYRQVTVCTL